MVVDWVSRVGGVAVGWSFMVEPLNTNRGLHTGALLEPSRGILKTMGMA